MTGHQSHGARVGSHMPAGALGHGCRVQLSFYYSLWQGGGAIFMQCPSNCPYLRQIPSIAWGAWTAMGIFLPSRRSFKNWSRKQKIHIHHGPAIPFRSVCPTEKHPCAPESTCTRMVTAALRIVARTAKHPRVHQQENRSGSVVRLTPECPSQGE